MQCFSALSVKKAGQGLRLMKLTTLHAQGGHYGAGPRMCPRQPLSGELTTQEFRVHGFGYMVWVQAGMPSELQSPVHECCGLPGSAVLRVDSPGCRPDLHSRSQDLAPKYRQHCPTGREWYREHGMEAQQQCQSQTAWTPSEEAQEAAVAPLSSLVSPRDCLRVPSLLCPPLR